VPLRFDDPGFVRVCQTVGTDLYETLSKLLGCEPNDVDWTPYVREGVRIDARTGITQNEDDQIANKGQQTNAKEGIRVDIVEINRLTFATWVKGVSADDGDAAKIWQQLSSPRKSDRAEAFSSLPLETATALLARLRVHIEEASKPAMRDPKLSQATDEEEA